MTDLLRNWLNNEIELSQPIENFEQDFANGYLFGELLFKFNQQSNFKEFSKKEQVAAKIDNFHKLEVTFRNLKIKINSLGIDKIMKGERGEALRLLYQLRMALEKVYPPTDIAVLRKTGKMGDNQPAQKIAPQKEKYDAQAHQFTLTRLQALNKPQKQLNQEKHLQKFGQEQVRQQRDATQYHKEQLQQHFKIKQEIRAASINKLQRNAGFMEEWLQKGVEDWKKNQSITKDREKRELEFEYKQTEIFSNLTMRKIGNANSEVIEGIANFEQTLKKIGISPYVKQDFAEKVVSESLQNSPSKSITKMHKMSQSLVSRPAGNVNAMTTKTGGMTLTSTGLKGKDKKTITDQTRKERERRRRKMIVDQGKTHFEMDQKRREQQIVDRMKRQAKQEVELGYEEWRTRECKNVIEENRKLREARYEKRRELDQQNANWREEEMIKGLEGQIGREMEVLQERNREMRIVKKQAQREGRSDFAADLVDSILEIANQAYIHQQLCDTEELDTRNWHEWMQLFVEQCVIDPPAQRDSDMIEEGEDLGADPVRENNERLDHMELVDYLENKGQWPASIIQEYKVNIEHILTGQSDQPVAPAGKGVKAPPKQQVEQIQIEEGDTEVPQTAPNNFALGDAIETIININFESRQKLKRPVFPHYVTLKVCFIGYQFTGKKAQAEKLKDLYGLQTVQMSDLVQEAIEFSNAHPEQIEGVKYISEQEEEQLQDENTADNTSEPDLNGLELNPFEDFRLCGIQIQELLLEGKEISDELYVQLFVSKLRMSFPYQSKKEIYEESRKKVIRQRELFHQLTEIEKQLNGEALTDPKTGKRQKKKTAAELQKEQQECQTELEQLKKIEDSGWILIDFPSSYAQAKLLETALSGYLPEKEQDPIQREIQMQESNLLVQGNEKEVPPVRLIKSGLDSVIWFNANLENCLNRAIGRRFDQTNEKMYHIQQQPPLTTNAPLCERLVPMDEEFNSEATLIDRWIAFDAHRKSLESWLQQFGDPENDDNCLLSYIDADGSEDQTFEQIKQLFDQIVQRKQEKEDYLRDVEITNKLNEEEEKERLRIEQEEEEKKRLEEEALLGEKKEEVKKENKVEKPGQVSDKIGPKTPSIDNIDNDIKGTLHKQWETVSVNYKGQTKKAFSGVRAQRERLIARFSHLQQYFLQFLHRPDAKQDKLEQFVRDFNDFSDAYPDLREDDQTKDEMHQRVDILSDELWEIIEERKDQEVDERKKIMESGWIEFELQFMVACAQQLMQAEVDRFKGDIQLVHDYYHLFEDKLVPESPQLLTTELVNEGEELPAVEVLQEGQDQFNIDHYTYPRLDKIFERALKAQVVPDVTIVQTSAQDKKGAPAKGKDLKKPAQEEEKPLEESIYVKEMKKAIKVEKSLLRFRLIQIRNWALKRLKEMRSKALKVYQKLEDWIFVAVKTENEAVDEMSAVIKKAIEEEKKIQDELRIKFMDFLVDEKHMNYIEPPPEKLPALEQLKSDRFSIPQLRSIVEELDTIAQELGNQPNIPNKVAVDLFVRKYENSKTIGDESGLPEDWKRLTEYDFQTIVRNLDKYNQGQVNWKLLATFLCMLQSAIPLEKEADAYQQELTKLAGKDLLIDEEAFAKVKAWFDQHEYSKDRDYSVPFTRVKYIKDLLFRINREEKNGQFKLNVKKLVTLLKAKEITMFKRSIKAYADILFAPIEK